MAELGDVFLTTYSILFGIMLNGALGLGIFHFGYIGKYDQNNVSRRIAVGFILLNIIPFAYFACIFPKCARAIAVTCYDSHRDVCILN